jgi:hypothetical protein
VRARRNQDGQAEEELAQYWRRRLGRLVDGDPEPARELRRVLDERLYPLLPEEHRPPPRGSRTNNGYTFGENSQIIQVSGDMSLGR